MWFIIWLLAALLFGCADTARDVNCLLSGVYGNSADRAKCAEAE